MWHEYLYQPNNHILRHWLPNQNDYEILESTSLEQLMSKYSTIDQIEIVRLNADNSELLILFHTARYPNG